MIMMPKREEPLSATNPHKYDYIGSQLSIAVYGDVEPTGERVKFRTAQEVAEICDLNYMQRLRKRASRVPNWYRKENPRFDEKLGILEKAIGIKAE